MSLYKFPVSIFRTCVLLSHSLMLPSKKMTAKILTREFVHITKQNDMIKCKHYKMRRNHYFKHKYSAQVEAAVNKQIRAEQQAGQDYLSMAVYFLHPYVSRPGAGGFFMRMYEEEIGHMQDFVQYQLLRGGTVLIDGLDAPQQNPQLTLLDAFKKGLEMEKSVTVLLEDIVRAAESVKDFQCADFVTSVFLADQMRSVNEMSHHVTKLSRLCDEHAIYHYDLELAKTYPYTYKSKTAA